MNASLPTAECTQATTCGNGHPETHHVKVEANSYRRLTLLAQIGEAYLALEHHRAGQDDCVRRIRELHGSLEVLSGPTEGVL